MKTKTDINLARRELFKIAKFYPTLAGLLAKTVTPNSDDKYGTVWCRTIDEACIDADHFCNVCDEFSSGSLDLPEPADRLCREIIREVRWRTAEENRKLEQFEKYHQTKPTNAMSKVRNDGVYGWWAIELGRMVRDGKITREQNDERMKELRDYDRGKRDLPSWCGAGRPDA